MRVDGQLDQAAQGVAHLWQAGRGTVVGWEGPSTCSR